MTTIPRKLSKTWDVRAAAKYSGTAAGYSGTQPTSDSSPNQEHEAIDRLSGKDRDPRDVINHPGSQFHGASRSRARKEPQGTWVPKFGWVVVDEVERAAINGFIDPRFDYGAKLRIPEVKQQTKDSIILEPFTAGRRTTPPPPEPNMPRLPTPSLSPNRHRREERQSRLALPLLIKHSSVASNKVMACPDSGSSHNIISLELVDKLRLEIDFNEQRDFLLPNRSTVTALGKVSTSCSFVTGPLSEPSKLECTFYVFRTLAVELIMGVGFLQQTETLSKHKDRLVEQIRPAMQSLRVNSVGKHKRGLICRLGTFVGCATVDTGSDLDLISPAFAKSRFYKIEPRIEKVEFADCSVGYAVGAIKTSFVVGGMRGSEFHPRGETIDIELFVLDNLTADILIGQDTIEELDIFNLHNESLIANIPRPGEPDINIIRHIGSIEQRAITAWKKIKVKINNNTSDKSAVVASQNDIDQRENARREQARSRIAKLSGCHKQRAQTIEDERIQAFEEQNLVSMHVARSGTKFTVSPPISSSTAQAVAASPINNGGITQKQTGGYKCTHDGCTAAPFPTRVLLDAHSNMHTSSRSYHCPVKGCARGEGGKAFKKKYEMIRHGLEHPSAGYVCPFCKNIEHKYPRPENLQRHFRVHHADKSKDDPLLCDALAHSHDGSISVKRRSAPQS